MILTHVLAFFYDRSYAWLTFFIGWGATICYVTFVFAYGIGYGKRLLKGLLNPGETIRRLAVLLLGYYFIASWVYSIWADRILNLDEFFKIVFFIELPAYTEFLPTFVFFGLFVLAAQKQLVKLFARPWVILITAILIYVTARILYIPDWGGDISNTFKGLLVGSGDLNRWGVLSYLPILLFGLAWGGNLEKTLKTRTQQSLFAFFAVGAYILVVTGLSSWSRWPPSVYYLLYGLAYSFGVLAIWPLIEKTELITKGGAFLGKYAFDFFIGHTLVVITAAALLGYQTFPEAVTLSILAAVILVISIASRIIHKIAFSI